MLNRHLDHFEVMGHPAVDSRFPAGNLGAERGGQTFANEAANRLVDLIVMLKPGILIVNGHATPVTLSFPKIHPMELGGDFKGMTPD